MPEFVHAVLEFHDEEARQATLSSSQAPNNKQDMKEPETGDPQLNQRIKASKKLIYEIKKLFAFMTISDKKYADPTNVLKALVDDFGNSVEIGEQKDIGEFN